MHFEPAPIRQVTLQESMMEEVLLQERLNKE
jgi:hypothetical protein